MTSRLAEVEPERMAGWLARFEASHGPLALVAGATGAAGVQAVAPDGAQVLMSCLWPDLDRAAAPGPGTSGTGDAASLAVTVAALAEQASRPRLVAVLLVRRGGWVSGLVAGGHVLGAAHGTRYVQARTAAGGWSQQRYARRRDGQAATLVQAAASRTVAMLADAHASRGDALTAARAALSSPSPTALAIGGDRGLVDDVLDDPRLADLAALPRSPLLAVTEPRRAVLTGVAARVRCLRVVVHDPA